MNYLLEGVESTRLVFRRIDLKDFDCWLIFFKDPSSFKYWNGELEAPEVECKKWYEKQFYRYENALGGMNALIEKKSNKLIGHAGLLKQKVDGIDELEIAYSLLPIFRNDGFATEAAATCKEFAFKNRLAKSLISIISTSNVPSANVAIKNGMKIDKQTRYNENDVNIFRING